MFSKQSSPSNCIIRIVAGKVVVLAVIVVRTQSQFLPLVV
jgi:hypothetical protein